MKGLLKKEFYMAWRYCKMYLVIIVIFLGITFAIGNGELNFFFVIYPFLMIGMIPMTLLAYDERSGWLQYSAALPCSRGQIVSVKFLSGSLYVVITVAAYLAVFAGLSMANGGSLAEVGPSLLPMGALCLTAGLVTPTLCLPFTFALGVEKGRLSYYAAIVIICVLGPQALRLGGVTALAPYLAKTSRLLLAVAALYALSWQLSIALYKRREL